MVRAPAEVGRPDLLALVRQQYELPDFVLQTQSANAGLKMKDGRGQWPDSMKGLSFSVNRSGDR